MTVAPRRSVVLGTVAAALLLLLAAPTPTEAVRVLRDAGAATDQTAPLVALLALVAWVLAAWLALTVLLTVGGHLPGLAGRALAAVARRVAPAAVRRAVEVGFGLTVVVGTLGASPALAAPGPAAGPGGAPVAASLDWAAPAPADAPRLDWGSTPAPEAPAADLDWAAAQPTPDSPQPDVVVVQPGDSLWELAERDLAARGDTRPTDAEVAQAWPTWWQANRVAIGEDPDLIQPGTPLTPPGESTPPTSS